ncbi:RimK domain-containing protein ATP-grasp [Stanieria sp. NIES-3757]|uniref:RimK domain-containing protein ATP-grasp n=2 Tax=Stanieria sp. NIES-3757 TaxID=1807358 RepID=A0ACD6B9D7_9CYAN|nr:RimK domain-containing protein ATP-grasp [Stanieria sp. NIES-3757]
MLTKQAVEPVRINARTTDVFDIFNVKQYVGANPYLNQAALVFDFAFTESYQPLPIENYLAVVGDRYPRLKEIEYQSYAELFASTVAEVNKLEMDLHLKGWNVKPIEEINRIAIESLHHRTTKEVVYCVWDWFEFITQGEEFDLSKQIAILQQLFRNSVYGGPTVYALLRTANEKHIPAFYLWDEGLMQYGYGKQQVRGIATTFDVDSHIDSDFTTQKDDCKKFLQELGFPVPQGDVVFSLAEAKEVAAEIGYPVAVKPVAGHKGIGVTADVQDEIELEAAYDRAVAGIPLEEKICIIVENSIAGHDYRLLCVNGRFVAATERKPAYVVGDGYSTIAELIEKENFSPNRSDTPTSPMGKIRTDEAMHLYLEEQGLDLDSVIDRDRTIYLRKVANLSSGGFSIDATNRVHPDNIILAQDIAQHFRLTCLGIDIITNDIGRSWKETSFGIIEINAAPGVYMHLKPAIGEPVDVTARILETFFETEKNARIPIITFNRVSIRQLQKLSDRILMSHPDWTIGAVCREGILINRSEKILNRHYNTNVLNLLRNPKLDLLIAEYDEDALEAEGMFYHGSNLVVLEDPSEIEMILTRDVFSDSTVIIKQGREITIKRKGLLEQYELEAEELIEQVYLKEIGTIS